MLPPLQRLREPTAITIGDYGDVPPVTVEVTACEHMRQINNSYTID